MDEMPADVFAELVAYMQIRNGLADDDDPQDREMRRMKEMLQAMKGPR